MKLFIVGAGVLCIASLGLFVLATQVSAEEGVTVSETLIDQTSEVIAPSPQAGTERMSPKVAKCYWPKFRSCMSQAGFGKANGRSGKAPMEECQYYYYASGQTADCYYAFEDCNRSAVSDCSY